MAIKLLYEELTFQILGAAMMVHRTLGPGFVESVYQRSMQIELRAKRIPYEAQRRIPLVYAGSSVGEHLLDLVVDDKVVVELKAAKALIDQHLSQTMSYLKAARLPIGLVINFGKPNLEHRRLMLSAMHRSPSV